MRYKDVKKILVKNGYVLVRSKGSHMQFSIANGPTVTVPNHGSKDISSFVLSSLKRATGLSFTR